jgi:outer membrane receptor for ferric coprogen and ferric-rhodotorulic acid
LDWYEGNNETANTQLKENRHVTRYAGLIYDINDTYSVYTSFTDIFKPQSVLGADNSYLKPIVGKSYEVGVKGEYFDGALNAGAALFLVNQENRAVDDTSGPFPCPNGNIGSPNFCQRASGEVQSKGIDLDVSGAITENWQASAGYTYAHVVYKKDADNQGDRFNPEMPQHLFKLNTSYRFPDQKWRVGGTVTAQTNTYPSGYTTFQQSGYAVFDAMLGYKVNEHIDTRVNFNNILDKTYYSGVGFASLNYGDPRNMMFTVKWSL